MSKLFTDPIQPTRDGSVLFLDSYQYAAMKTAKDMGSELMNLTHAALGLASDSGEFVDAIKKWAIYGKELDRENCIEELGDILWFCALAAQTLGVDLNEVATKNIRKLQKRYPDKYSDEAAIERADKKQENQENQESPVGKTVIKYVIAESQEHAESGLQIAGPFDSIAEAQRSGAYKDSRTLFEVRAPKYSFSDY